ncbi:MAG TPA: SpoIIE family protein phosphatase, partial [Spirochaetota bacterium]|nr:SpoIIE family protein phosphatase [Spirochaetota bacterium]
GERIILFTDGLVEARNTSDQMIGNENFYKILSERNSLSIEEMCLKVFEDVSNYSKGIDPDDDKTILITEIKKC